MLCSLPRERGVHDAHALGAALFGAADNGHAAVVAFLCDHVDARNPRRSRALDVSIQKGHLDVVCALLQSQPDAAWSDALQRAARYGCLGVLLPLVDKLHARGYKNLPTCLSLVVSGAACGGQAGVVKALCDLPCEFGVNAARTRGHENLCNAASYGHVEVVKVLCSLPVDRGVAVARRSPPEFSALRIAAEHNHVDVVRFLCALPLDRGVDPSADDFAALHHVARLDRVDVARELCAALWERKRLPPADVMLSVMQKAVRHNALRCVRLLCTVIAGPLRASKLLEDSVRVWPEPGASVVRQELRWQRARSLLVITHLLRNEQASRRVTIG